MKTIHISNSFQDLINGLIDTKVGNKIVDSIGNGYIKFTNGLMICYGKKQKNVNITNIWSGTTALLYSCSIQTGESFAQDFNTIPTVLLDVESGSTCWICPAGTSSKTKHYSYQLLSAAPQNNLTVYVKYLAIGTWK